MRDETRRYSGTIGTRAVLGQPGLLPGDPSPSQKMMTTGTVDTATGIPYSSSVVSVSAIIKLGALTGSNRLVSHGWSGAGGWQLGLSTAGTTPFLGLNSGTGDLFFATSSNIGAGIHHLLGTYDGTNLRIYVDGALGGSLATADFAISTSGSIVLADSQNDALWLQDVAIWNRALTDSEIARLYAAGLV